MAWLLVTYWWLVNIVRDALVFLSTPVIESDQIKKRPILAKRRDILGARFGYNAVNIGC